MVRDQDDFGKQQGDRVVTHPHQGWNRSTAGQGSQKTELEQGEYTPVQATLFCAFMESRKVMIRPRMNGVVRRGPQCSQYCYNLAEFEQERGKEGFWAGSAHDASSFREPEELASEDAKNGQISCADKSSITVLKFTCIEAVCPKIQKRSFAVMTVCFVKT